MNEITIMKSESLDSIINNIKAYEEVGRTSLFAIAKQLEKASYIIENGNTEYNSITEFGNKIFGYSKSNVSKMVSISKLFIKENNEVASVKYNIPTISHAMELLPLFSDKDSNTGFTKINEIFPDGFDNESVLSVRKKVAEYINNSHIDIEDTEIEDTEIEDTEIEDTEIEDIKIEESTISINTDDRDFIINTLNLLIPYNDDLLEDIKLAIKILMR